MLDSEELDFVREKLDEFSDYDNLRKLAFRDTPTEEILKALNKKDNLLGHIILPETAVFVVAAYFFIVAAMNVIDKYFKEHNTFMYNSGIEKLTLKYKEMILENLLVSSVFFPAGNIRCRFIFEGTYCPPETLPVFKYANITTTLDIRIDPLTRTVISAGNINKSSVTFKINTNLVDPFKGVGWDKPSMSEDLLLPDLTAKKIKEIFETTWQSCREIAARFYEARKK